MSCDASDTAGAATDSGARQTADAPAEIASSGAVLALIVTAGAGSSQSSA